MSSLNDRFETCDLIVRSAITIGCPVTVVWPRFLELQTWMIGLQFKHIEGEHGEEGEVRRVTPDGESQYRAYFIRTVRVKRHEQYVLNVVPQQGEDYWGFADFSFTETEGSTRLVYDIYLQLKVSGKNSEELSELCAEQHQKVYEEVTRNNENLKFLIEGARACPR
jgi:hypothetical protein